MRVESLLLMTSNRPTNLSPTALKLKLFLKYYFTYSL